MQCRPGSDNPKVLCVSQRHATMPAPRRRGSPSTQWSGSRYGEMCRHGCAVATAYRSGARRTSTKRSNSDAARARRPGGFDAAGAAPLRLFQRIGLRDRDSVETCSRRWPRRSLLPGHAARGRVHPRASIILDKVEYPTVIDGNSRRGPEWPRRPCARPNAATLQPLPWPAFAARAHNRERFQ